LSHFQQTGNRTSRDTAADPPNGGKLRRKMQNLGDLYTPSGEKREEKIHLVGQGRQDGVHLGQDEKIGGPRNRYKKGKKKGGRGRQKERAIKKG